MSLSPSLGFLWFCSRCLLGGVTAWGSVPMCAGHWGPAALLLCSHGCPLMWTASHQNKQLLALPACWFNPKMLQKCMPGVLIHGLRTFPVGLAPVSQPCSSLLCTLVAVGGTSTPLMSWLWWFVWILQKKNSFCDQILAALFVPLSSLVLSITVPRSSWLGCPCEPRDILVVTQAEVCWYFQSSQGW